MEKIKLKHAEIIEIYEHPEAGYCYKIKCICDALGFVLYCDHGWGENGKCYNCGREYIVNVCIECTNEGKVK